MDTLNIEQIAIIDLAEYTKAGTYKVPVQFKLPDGCTLTEDVEVELVLEEKDSGGN